MHKKYNKRLKTLGPKAAYLVTMLHDRGKSIFRHKDVEQMLNLDRASSRDFVSRLVERGIVTRIKPGLFILIPYELGETYEYIGNWFVVAREIMEGKGYYLSHGTAMEIHQMLTQPQLVVYITTVKHRRAVNALGVEFRFIHAPKKFLFGIDEYWATKQEKVMVSNIERTVIDCLNTPKYCAGIIEAAKGLWMRQQDVNVNRLIEYAMKIGKSSVAKRLGYILELFKIGTNEQLEILRHNINRDTYVRLDPALTNVGKYHRKWGIRLNVSPEELESSVST